MTSVIHNSINQSQTQLKQSFCSPYKIVFIGQNFVGKTSILTKYISNSFIQNYIPTIGLGYYKKEIKFPHFSNCTLSFELWDTSCLEKAAGINLQIIETAHIIVMVYDITKKETLDYLKKYIQECKVPEHVLLVVVCNKIDKQEETDINDSQGKEFARSINAVFHLTSAKTSSGIKKLFNIIGNKIIQNGNSEEYYYSEDSNINDSISKNVPVATKDNSETENKDQKCIIV